MEAEQNKKNSKSIYRRIIKEICAELDIAAQAFSYDWVFRLNKNGRTRYLIGYKFDLNTDSVQSICQDKCAAYDILSFCGIPCVEHFLFLSPQNVKYTGEDGNWKRMADLLEKYGRLVLKPNEGTGGGNVLYASGQAEMECAADVIFKKSRSMAVSPFYDIRHEYRAVCLDGQVKLVYSKEIPHIAGDSRSNVAELIFKYIDDNRLKTPPFDLNGVNLRDVLKDGEIFRFNWKHNLESGATPRAVDDAEVTGHITRLALSAVKELNIRFASVDIILAGNEYKILEINSGVMMEHFAGFNNENYETAKSIYKDAIKKLFGL